MKHAHAYRDEALISEVREPRTRNQAILALYRQYEEHVRSFIMSKGAGPDEAADVFQETVLAFVDAILKDKYRGESAVRTYLMAIAKYTWYNELTRKKRAEARELKFESGRAAAEPDVSEQIRGRETGKQFRQVLDQLGDPCRKILILFYYENLSMKEMLDHLPYENEQVIRNKKYKCLQQLAEMIKGNAALAAQLQEIIQ